MRREGRRSRFVRLCQACRSGCCGIFTFPLVGEVTQGRKEDIPDVGIFLAEVLSVVFVFLII